MRHAGGVDELAEQERPAVAEAGREAAELVAGVGLGDRHDVVAEAVPDERRDARRRPQLVDVEPELACAAPR